MNALLSVSNKEGLLNLAQVLHSHGVRLISTGGTAAFLKEAGLPVTQVEALTGFAEMLDGRVKTLHPAVHGGLLARRHLPEDMQALAQQNIAPIDIAVVNLYPFEATVAKAGVSLEEAIENIDIGGPTMVRSAAKNWQDVVVLTDPAQYSGFIDTFQATQGKQGNIPKAYKFSLAVQAFNRISRYDAAISNYLSALQAVGVVQGEEALQREEKQTTPGIALRPSGGAVQHSALGMQPPETTQSVNPLFSPAEGQAVAAQNPGSFPVSPVPGLFPDQLNLCYLKVQDLRYGENPHQSAALYRTPKPAVGAFATALQLQGKPLSYNNIADGDAAWECVKSFASPACVIVKHANPCGVALGTNAQAAYAKAFKTDPSSAFGGILAFNCAVDAAAAQALLGQFVEVLVAPSFTDEALNLLASKPNVRVLQIELPSASALMHLGPGLGALQTKHIGGGLLIQTLDEAFEGCNVIPPLQQRADLSFSFEGLKVTSQCQPTAQQRADLLFAFEVAKHVKSNAIVFCADGATLGIGAGQMSRIDATQIAVLKAQKAGLSLQGSVVASDAFFPFRDGVDALAEAGAAAVIHPGGSMRDEEVLAAANEHGLVMVTTGIRHFRH